MNVAHGKV